MRSVSTAIDVEVITDTTRIAPIPSTAWSSRKPERWSGVAKKELQAVDRIAPPPSPTG